MTKWVLAFVLWRRTKIIYLGENKNYKTNFPAIITHAQERTITIMMRKRDPNTNCTCLPPVRRRGNEVIVHIIIIKYSIINGLEGKSERGNFNNNIKIDEIIYL